MIYNDCSIDIWSHFEDEIDESIFYYEDSVFLDTFNELVLDTIVELDNLLSIALLSYRN